MDAKSALPPPPQASRIVAMNPEAKLAELGLTLPNPPAAAGSYVPTVRMGNLL